MSLSLQDALRKDFPIVASLNAELVTPTTTETTVLTQSSRDTVIAEFKRLYPFCDPFRLNGGIAGEEGEMWGISNPQHQRVLIALLCVDHADLQEVNEREAALQGVGAVITKRTPKGQSRKAGGKY